MKRKTNLFYTTGPDSKFITFSNYTECLTGNFLSLETKLFPDKFLCLKIHNLNEHTKPLFIKFLSTYYENKLAMLRDHNIEMNLNIESNILPLSYLLEGIMLVCNTYDVEGEWSLDLNKLNKAISTQYIFNDDEDILENRPLYSLITYIGEITEQDYNGTYTDTICSIDLTAYCEGEIIMKQSSTSENHLSVNTENINSLYGWENDYIINDYESSKPIYDLMIDDSTGTYNYSSSISRIKVNKISNNENSSKLGQTLYFNLIIPLFSLVNKNISHDNWSIYKNESNQYNYIDLEQTSSDVGFRYIYDVPLGIWIHAEEQEDSFIELKMDNSMNLYPSWSLLISSQFKPFPYSNKFLEPNEAHQSILNAHATYAEVLSKMNNVLDIFTSFANRLNLLEERLNTIESKNRNIATESNISDMNEYMLNTEKRVLDELKDIKKKFYGHISNITWSGVG